MHEFPRFAMQEPVAMLHFLASRAGDAEAQDSLNVWHAIRLSSYGEKYVRPCTILVHISGQLRQGGSPSFPRAYPCWPCEGVGMHVPEISRAAYLFHLFQCKSIWKINNLFHYHVPCISPKVALCFHVTLHPSLSLGQSHLGLQMCTIAASYSHEK